MYTASLGSTRLGMLTASGSPQARTPLNDQRRCLRRKVRHGNTESYAGVKVFRWCTKYNVAAMLDSHVTPASTANTPFHPRHSYARPAVAGQNAAQISNTVNQTGGSPASLFSAEIERDRTARSA